MMTKRIPLLAASALLFTACQMQPDGVDVAATSAQVNLSNITHVPLGGAVLSEQGGRLFATNMRTIADGVRSLFQPSVAWQASLLWASNVSAIRMNAINSSLSGEDTTSSLSLDRVGTHAWTARATFVSPTSRVNVYSGSVLRGSIPHNLNQPVTLLFDARYPYVGTVAYPSRFYVRPWWSFFNASRNENTAGNPAPMQQCSWELGLPPGARVVQGSTVLAGDRVELIEDPHESYGGVDEVQVLGNGDVTYFSEQVVPE
jgi:hypothetical protein